MRTFNKNLKKAIDKKKLLLKKRKIKMLKV